MCGRKRVPASAVDEEWDEQLGEEDIEVRRCRVCKRTFEVKRGQKVRHCPYCGAAQVRGVGTRLGEDPRVAREL